MRSGNALVDRAAALVAEMTEMVKETAVPEAEVERCFGQHPDAEIVTSQPGFGAVLGARLLAEFGGDAPATPTGRRAPATPASASFRRCPAPARCAGPLRRKE